MVLLGPESKVDFQPLYVRNQSRSIGTACKKCQTEWALKLWENGFKMKHPDIPLSMSKWQASTPTGVWLNFVLDRVRSRVHGIKLDMHKIWHPTYLLLWSFTIWCSFHEQWHTELGGDSKTRTSSHHCHGNVDAICSITKHEENSTSIAEASWFHAVHQSSESTWNKIIQLGQALQPPTWWMPNHLPKWTEDERRIFVFFAFDYIMGGVSSPWRLRQGSHVCAIYPWRPIRKPDRE